MTMPRKGIAIRDQPAPLYSRLFSSVVPSAYWRLASLLAVELTSGPWWKDISEHLGSCGTL